MSDMTSGPLFWESRPLKIPSLFRCKCLWEETVSMRDYCMMGDFGGPGSKKSECAS